MAAARRRRRQPTVYPGGAGEEIAKPGHLIGKWASSSAACKETSPFLLDPKIPAKGWGLRRGKWRAQLAVLRSLVSLATICIFNTFWHRWKSIGFTDNCRPDKSREWLSALFILCKYIYLGVSNGRIKVSKGLPFFFFGTLFDCRHWRH